MSELSGYISSRMDNGWGRGERKLAVKAIPVEVILFAVDATVEL